MFGASLHGSTTMRKFSLSILAPLAALAALPTASAANCYSVYDAQNRLVFQSTVTPIDLSGRISETMRQTFPGTFLIMLPDDADCREVRSGAVVTRFTPSVPSAARPPNEILTASPLTGGVGSGDSGNSVSTREAARSGNALNVKRK
jgi:hypothetical protein